MRVRAFLTPRSIESLRGAWLPIRLTAVFLLLNGAPIWYLLALMITFAGLGLVYHALLRIPAFWAGVAIFFFVWILRLWPLVDNHQYLAGYWMLALLIGLSLPDPPTSVATSARWLLVFVFLWAALWKGVLSPDYRDGRFFSVRLMTDSRFEQQASLLSGLSVHEVRRNRVYLRPADAMPDSIAGRELPRPTEMHSTPRFRFWVQVITWSVLAFEAALGLAFLLPLGRWTSALRHGGLMIFCLGTFAFAPVRTFGWILATMGLAQVPEDRRLLRALYVIVWVLIAFVSHAPWAHVNRLIT